MSNSSAFNKSQIENLRKVGSKLVFGGRAVAATAASAVAVAGVLATDTVVCSVNVGSATATNDVIQKAVPTADTITVTFVGDGAGREVGYLVYR